MEILAALSGFPVLQAFAAVLLTLAAVFAGYKGLNVKTSASAPVAEPAAVPVFLAGPLSACARDAAEALRIVQLIRQDQEVIASELREQGRVAKRYQDAVLVNSGRLAEIEKAVDTLVRRHHRFAAPNSFD